MVKTRHSAGADDLAYGEFITIPTSTSRGGDGIQNQVNGYQDEGDSEELEEELPRTRRTRGNVNMNIFEGSTTDDDTPMKDTRRQRFRSSSDPRENAMRSDGRSSRTHPRSASNRHRRVEEQVVVNEIRRSGRQRKVTYDTLNQGLINKQLSYLSASEMNGYCDHEEDNPRKKRRQEVEPEKGEEMVDMYTRVKRDRPRIKRNMYGVPVKEEEEQEGSSNDESDEVTEEEETQNARSYYLREQRQRTQIYEAPIEPKRNRPRNIFREGSPPPSRPRRHVVSYRSPARRQSVRRRRKAAFHGSSSTSSSSSADSEDDERRFERRKAKSMTKSRQRCLPMNLTQDDVATGFIRDRMKIGSSLADVDPMNVDRSVTFDKVGGLGKHIRQLKEMVVFPLLYPEVFEKFSVSPPRGVLFYGPPGTGKTLVARALANECSSGERKVAFFMRKGADCLSKWVGESERQLRLLFDQAYQMRPSIIFFDEIDGLAPVRSSRQDQIHSSIVSTLLALMDGLDNRGEIVVIGATNRIDSIDPALRRPGRFDREFLFPLPSLQARAQILTIHTNAWTPKLSSAFIHELAEKCVGYCGADLRALCTETALQALRRRYPQIYHSQDKLQLDVNSILVKAQDFHRAMQVIVPTAQRSVATPARALPHSIRPLLRDLMNEALAVLRKIFPPSATQLTTMDARESSATADADNEFHSDVEDGPDIFEASNKGKGRKKLEMGVHGPFLDFARMVSRPQSHRPRLLLSGTQGQGQTTHLAPGLLHQLERMPVQTMDLPALFAVSARTAEESCAHVFREAKRTCPSIIYVPHIDHWWEVIGDTLRATFLTLLHDLEPSSPILFLATSDEDLGTMPLTLRHLFSASAGEVVVMANPSDSQRREYFEELLLKIATRPPPTHKQAAKIALEELPPAAPREPRPLTETELKRLQEQEEVTLRELRLFLREVLTKLGRDKKFTIFTKPVDEEEVPDYYEIIANPMDLSTMMKKIDLHQYQTVKDFMSDLELIVSNALEYNPETDPADRAIRHRACALKDTAQAILVAELDEEFEKLCEEIKEARARRGEKSTATVPSYFFTKPLGKGRQSLMKVVAPEQPQSYASQVEDANGYDDQQDSEVIVPKVRTIVKRIVLPRANKKYRSPWCRPSKRQYRKVIVYLDEDGNEIGQEGGNIRSSRKGGEEAKDSDSNNESSVEMEKEEQGDIKLEAKETDQEPEQTKDEECASVDAQDEVDSKDVLEDDTESKSIAPSPTEGSPRRPASSPRGRSQGSPRSGRSSRRDTRSPVSGGDRTGKGHTLVGDTADIAATPCSTNTGTTSRKRLSTAEDEQMEISPSEQPSKCEVDDKPDENTSPKHVSSSKVENTEETQAVAGNTTEEETEDKKEPSPQMRVTRSQMHPAQRQKAMAILEEQTQHVTVDQAGLSSLLDKTVRLTEGCKLEDLEKLYSMMNQCIYQHRKDFNKDMMVQELERTLREFIACKR